MRQARRDTKCVLGIGGDVVVDFVGDVIEEAWKIENGVGGP
jgi:hypothetical protein